MILHRFVRRYKVLKRIDFRLVRPNSDIDAGEILQQVRELGQGLKAEKTEVTTTNSDGLDIEASIETITAATQTGNQDVKLDGVDQDGNKISGNNEKFSDKRTCVRHSRDESWPDESAIRRL